MRVTDTMIFTRAQTSTGRARTNSERATAEMSTGLRVAQPGDDPTAAGLITSHTLGAARSDAISKVVSSSSDELLLTDGALEGVSNALSRARELAVQLGNSNYAANERTAGAGEVNGLIKQAIASLNVKVGDRFIFGGFLDNASPFDATGNYLGDTGVRQVEVAPGVTQAVSIRADQVIKGVGGGVDVLSALTSLSTALSTNNQAGILATLDTLDSSISQVAAGRSQVGTYMNVFDAAAQVGRASRDAELTTVSHLQDADAFESATRLALTERALDAALTASARSFKLTLLDKL